MSLLARTHRHGVTYQ